MMSCKHPLFGVRSKGPGSPLIIYGSVHPDHDDLLNDEYLMYVDSVGEAIFNPAGYICVRGKWYSKSDIVQVPCGKCSDCRLSKSREWADRCVMESMYYDLNKCWFLTVTYNDEHLPPWCSGYVSSSPYPSGSLVCDELSEFVRRLRDSARATHRDANIRYYGCGEYGAKNLRPHYHLILFGLDLSDNDYYKRNKLGDPLYNNKWIERIWGNGFAVIGHFDWRTAAYTARYVMKKRKGQKAKQEYEDLDIIPEYNRMSLKPGIAANYYFDHMRDMYLEGNQRIVLPAVDGKPNITTPPRYFDQLFARESDYNYDLLCELKEERRRLAEIAERGRKAILGDMATEQEYLDFEENIFEKNPQFRTL